MKINIDLNKSQINYLICLIVFSVLFCFEVYNIVSHMGKPVLQCLDSILGIMYLLVVYQNLLAFLPVNNPENDDVYLSDIVEKYPHCFFVDSNFNNWFYEGTKEKAFLRAENTYYYFSYKNDSLVFSSTAILHYINGKFDKASGLIIDNAKLIDFYVIANPITLGKDYETQVQSKTL